MCDSVEFIMEVEETFAIEIPNLDAEMIESFGDVFEIVSSRLREKLGAPCDLPCLNLSAFNDVRRALLQTAALERNQIRPATSLEKVLAQHPSRKEKQKAWRNLGHTLKVGLPHLVPSRTLKRAVFLSFWLPLGGVPLISVILGYGLEPFYYGFFLFHLIGCLLVLAAMMWTTERLAQELPAEVATIGNLAELAASCHYGQWAQAQHGWNEGQVWKALCILTARQAHVPRDEIRRSTRLVEDLDLD